MTWLTYALARIAEQSVIQMKLLVLGALLRASTRRIKVAMASAYIGRRIRSRICATSSPDTNRTGHRHHQDLPILHEPAARAEHCRNIPPYVRGETVLVLGPLKIAVRVVETVSRPSGLHGQLSGCGAVPRFVVASARQREQISRSISALINLNHLVPMFRSAIHPVGWGAKLAGVTIATDTPAC